MSAGKFLYILCEGERDEMFYERLCERITGQTYIQPTDFRLRRGANWKTAMAGAVLLVNRFKHWTERQDIGLIIAVDNDRAPGHPGHVSGYPRPLPPVDQKKPERYPALVRMLEKSLGSDLSTWPVHVALAVPVEMIESWLLILLDPNCPELPLFSEASQFLPRQYYGSNPPPQLKDLRDEAAARAGWSQDEIFYHAADAGDLEGLTQRSPSFQLFRNDLERWL
jgi:hypothetical protein